MAQKQQYRTAINAMDILFAYVLVIAAFCLIIWLFYVLPYKMAEARNRRGLLWILIGGVITPFGAAIALFLLGDPFEQDDRM